jgi:predicted AlkP superfamily phosphohydrolase/phosphomutase
MYSLRLLRFAAVLSAVAALVSSCRRAPIEPVEAWRRAAHQTGVKVLLVGIDGLSPRLVDRFAAEGALPVTSDLIARGSYGVLRSENPTISPALWTTIATGRSRRAHGIKNFVARREGGRDGLVGSHDRRTHALWTIASAAGREVGFAGWWATWPAEAVDGWIVSDRLTEGRWVRWTKAERGTALAYPEALAPELLRQVVDPLSLRSQDVAEIVELVGSEAAEFDGAQEPILAHAASVLKFAWAGQRSIERVSENLLARGQPELTSVFLIANDPISHTFWHYFEPTAFPPFGADLEPRAIERLGRAIPNIYAHNDRALRRLLALVDPATVVILVSDHGFEASRRLPKVQLTDEDFKERDRRRAAGEAPEAQVAVGQSGNHSLRGVFLAAGGPIASGKPPVEARIHDVAPTILALLGLPIADDMDGRVLEEIFDPEFLRRFPVRRVPSYETLLPKAVHETQLEDEDRERLEMLRSLGYIQ